MANADSLVLFLVAGWVLNLTPGPDALYIVANSVRHGRRYGLLAGLGITAGCCVHVVAAAAGLGALLAASAWAFAAVKYLGAAYLAWTGVRMLLARTGDAGHDVRREIGGPGGTTPGRVLVRGFWTNVLNPKVALFFVACLPQFIPANATDKGLWFLSLGLLFNVSSVPINAGWEFAADWLLRHAAARRRLAWIDRLAGTLFVAFGAKLALATRPGA